jgi:hypothetical protein
MTRQQTLDRRRYYCLLWFLVGFVVWQGSRTVQEIWPSLEASLSVGFVTATALVGWGVFTYYLVRLLLMKRRLSHAERRQMNDERVRQSRRRSFAAGFWAMLGTTGSVLFASGLSSAAVANLLIFVGVGASIAAFLYLEATGGASAPNNVLGRMV